MPQFDKITFFNQIFWLFAFFSGFYFIFLKIFLPKLSSILKARIKKLQKVGSGVISFSKEQDNVTLSYNIFIEKVSFAVKNSVLDSTENSNFFLASGMTILNKESLNLSNIAMESSIHEQITKNYFFSSLTS